MTIKNTKIAGNLMDIFILGPEMFTSVSYLNLFMLETVLYNNTLDGWNGKSTKETYEEINSDIRNFVLQGYVNGLDLDLGSYTENFTQAFTEVILF